MNSPGLGVVQNSKAKNEGQRRGIPNLKQRPGPRQHGQTQSNPATGFTPAQVGFLDQLIELFGGIFFELCHLGPFRTGVFVLLYKKGPGRMTLPARIDAL